MFEFLFKYPFAAFAKGAFLFLAPLPVWVLLALLGAAGAALAALLFARRMRVAPALRSWRLAIIWAFEFLTIVVLLVLLWQPALSVTELKPRQNIVAILVDDSRSMGLSQNADVQGTSREAEAKRLLTDSILPGLQTTFQTRVYRFDSTLSRVADVATLGTAAASATHIGASLEELATQTADLPLGGIILMSDGGENSGGIDQSVVDTLRNRRVPVYTVGFGPETSGRDLELEDVVVAPRALADSRLSATVKFQQHGLVGQRTNLTVRDGARLLATQEVALAPEGRVQSANLQFNIGAVGAKTLRFAVQPLAGETSDANNAVTRLVNVEPEPRRILYFEGEPRWEYKFIRRAADDDSMIKLASLLRTTENKIYRQGLDDPNELANGFPTRAEELFPYQAIIMGSVDAGYFTATQQKLIHDFVDRRGGGLLLLGGRQSLADGVWSGPNVADLLPVVLPDAGVTFHRDPATASLTSAGGDSVITRLVDDPAANIERWKKLPYLMDYQDPGRAKAGATVLAEMHVGGRTMPLLVTESFGRGRTAVLATGGTWRWQMSLPLGDKSHDLFWQQLLRWLVADTRGQVSATVAAATLLDDGHAQIAAEVRDKDYRPAGDVKVSAHTIGPDGLSADFELTPTPNSPGRFRAEWVAPKAGVYVTEVSAQRGTESFGRDAVTFQRLDGVAEGFHTGQNRALLQDLATRTGGRYLRPSELGGLAKQIPYSQAGVSQQQIDELWNMPIFFLLLLMLRGGEWLLRRRWGVV